MANGFYVDPPNPLKALMLGGDAYASARKNAKDDEADAIYKQIGQQIANGGINNDALGKLYGLGASAAPMIAATASLGKADTTDKIRDYNFSQQQRARLGLPQQPFDEWETGMKIAGSTKINNTVNTGENEYAKVQGKNDAERFIGFQKEAQKAQSTKNTLDIMENITKDPNFYSGAGAERFALPIKQATVALGGDPNAAASMENFRALSNKAVLDSVGGSLGTGFSNADRDFVVAQVPGLQNTPEGNQRLIDISRKVSGRTQDIAKLARDYAKANGGRLDANFDSVLQDYAQKNPLFPQAAQSGAPAAPVPAPQSNPPVPGARKSPIDGKWYVPDVSRPGKFQRVDQ